MYLQMKLRQYACADCGKLSAGMREAARGADGSDEDVLNQISPQSAPRCGLHAGRTNKRGGSHGLLV